MSEYKDDIRYYQVLRKWKREEIVMTLRECILFERILRKRKRNSFNVVQAIIEVMDADYSNFEKELGWW